MSGGSSGTDPYHQKDPIKRSKVEDPQGELKSYRKAVKPTKIAAGPDGKKKYYYKCEHCGKPFETDKRKKHRRAFHNKTCQHEWDRGREKRKRTDKEKEALRKRTKSSWENPEIRKKRIQGIRKAQENPEYRKKLSEQMKRISSDPEWKKKQSEAQKGKKRPPEVGRKISAAKIGHQVSEKTREKLAEANRGEKSNFYIDGRSSERQRFYRSWYWRKKREAIKERDNQMCQACGLQEHEVDSLVVHHIKPLSDTELSQHDYPDKLLVTLCEVCHPVTDLGPGKLKRPLNGRGEKAKIGRLNDPKHRNPKLDDFP